MEAGCGPTADGLTFRPVCGRPTAVQDNVTTVRIALFNPHAPPALACATYTYSLPRMRLTLVRRPAVAATGRRLHLYHYGRRLSSSALDAAAVSPMRPIGGGMRQ